MKSKKWFFALILLAGAILQIVSRAIAQDKPDPALAAEIDRIKAIDNHAHPLRVTTETDQRDNEEDALDILPMPAFPLSPRIRADNPEFIAAWRALYGYPFADQSRTHLAELPELKRRAMRQHGDGYPTWVLDQLGIETMLANRVAMGPGLVRPRFRWVAFDDALMFPLDNTSMRNENPDLNAFYASEEVLLKRYLSTSKLERPPPTLQGYLDQVVSTTLVAQKNEGALAIKFEAAYLRSLDFGNPSKSEAEGIYARYSSGGEPTAQDYKALQDFIFRYIARECGRLGMPVHIHVAAGVGSYFKIAGANPLLLESVFNDPSLRNTTFVMIHGGWPFTAEAGALMSKPNVYADFSFQTYLTYPGALSAVIRSWLESTPDKVLFGTDAFVFGPEVGWEESGWLATRSARQALALALTGMVDDGEITRTRASELARMVLRQNAIALYKLR
ncbi:MAG: amidohydrolase family protein [Candidatus Binatus sp.]|uniref:amidohydrolase family protein n=1 Tax=Candidatus Binatus sp. TaxID=2811406 RepID=UPI0027211C40|nr:amidohydrolase family protein [Candidatus Binatus sp.]MDO8432658.1 amidohydrolase family protein [Candidatus Binatus sp.]